MSDEELFPEPEFTEEHVLDTVQWCRKEAGYAKTETEGLPNRRLNEIHERLGLVLDVLRGDSTYADDTNGESDR